jgi:hypothetical protein
MAHTLPPTLSEVREAVAIRLSFGAIAARAPTMRELLDEFIRRAASELLLEANWVELRVRITTDLIDEQGTYDFPDNMDPGRVERLVVVSTTGDEYELQADIQPCERAQFTQGGKDMPLRYEFVNEQIVLVPVPDAAVYPTMLIEGYMKPAAPKHNDDRIPVDKELLVQWATAIGKAHYGKPDAGVSMATAREFLRRVRSVQTDSSSVQIGGHFSRKFPYTRPRRTGAGWGNNYWLL